MMKIIISLTCIPPRFGGLKDVIVSLLKQTKKPDYIIINIPETYARFKDTFIIPKFIMNTPGLILNRISKDYGPASKLLGLRELVLYKELSLDSIIICVDDDRIYNNKLVETFINNMHDNRALCVAGWDINKLSNNVLSYNHLLYPRGVEYLSPGYIDILGGCCGFAMTKKNCPFYDETIFTLSSDDVKYYVDDVWISGFLTIQKVDIYMIPGYGDERRSSNDTIYPLCDESRTSKNIVCINYFRDNYGIWINRT